MTMPLRSFLSSRPANHRGARWLKDQALFLKAWARAPREIGSVMPSSSFLAHAVASQINPAAQGWVIEIGAGTGAMTKVLLSLGVNPERLLVIERNPRLSELLHARFPQARVLNADAQSLRSILRQYDIAEVHAVVSSLPFVSMPSAVRKSIIPQIAEAIGKTGILMQYTYRRTSPIPDRLLAKSKLQGKKVAMVWRNLPPASIWRYEADRE